MSQQWVSGQASDALYPKLTILVQMISTGFPRLTRVRPHHQKPAPFK